MNASLPDPATLTLVREAPIPVAVLTGFLGSGKTTLIRSLLADPAFAETAVVVNEFGEIGLDHLLVEAAGEDTVLLEGGCLCCASQGDLVRALRSLLTRRERAELPAYRRVIIETSGLADPAPILQTLMLDPLRLSRYRLARLTATVDGQLGIETLRRHSEAIRQLAFADEILITKTDLIDDDRLAETIAAIRAVSAAPVAESRAEQGIGAGFFQSPGHSVAPQAGGSVHHHDAYATVSRRFDGVLPWAEVESWLGRLIARCGAKLLRFKALLAIEGEDAPVLLQAVQHVVHRPERLASWPEARRESRIVLIAEGIEKASLAHLLDELLPVGVRP
jgi:G3E family GTPase